jgi:hypothetical protein
MYEVCMHQWLTKIYEFQHLKKDASQHYDGNTESNFKTLS